MPCRYPLAILIAVPSEGVMQKVLSALSSVALLCTCAAAPDALAADVYPSKHVTIITHVGPGSGPDVVSRIVADNPSHIWGKQVTIVNRQGAAALLAGQTAAKAPPDGYTLYLPTISGLVISPEIQPKFPVEFDR